MLYSSADILRVLGGSEIIRLTAKLHIVDGRPPLTGEDGMFIYVDRFPAASEFEVTWKLWVIDYAHGPVDVVLAEISRLLPKVAVKETPLGYELETTDFRSESTLTAPAPSKPAADQSYPVDLEERFQALLEDVQDQMLLIHSGAPGKDGRDGVDGKDGADGKDLNATEVELEDLSNVERGIAKEKGQVLTWDGEKWTNLHIPRTLLAGGSSASSGSGSGSSQPIGSTIQWHYRAQPVSQEPVEGNFHSDNVNGGLATVFRVSNVNQNNTNVELLVREILASGSNRLYLYDNEDPSQAQLYRIDGYQEIGAGFEIYVTHLDTVGLEPTFVQPKTYNFLFLSPSIADLEVGQLYQLIGVSAGSSNLGTFPGSIVSDNVSVKTAITEIEQYIENNLTTIDDVRLDAENKTFNYSNGQLQSVVGAQVQVAIAYDAQGRVSSVTKTSNGVSVTKTLSYASNGTLASIAIS